MAIQSARPLVFAGTFPKPNKLLFDKVKDGMLHSALAHQIGDLRLAKESLHRSPAGGPELHSGGDPSEHRARPEGVQKRFLVQSCSASGQ